MSVATLAIRASNLDGVPLTFAFDTFPSVDGYPSSQDWTEEEELTSPGIDSKRWRTVFKQWPPLVIDDGAPAWTAVTGHTAACTLADTMRQAKGRFGTLTVTSGGTRTVRMYVHVTGVHARVNPGPIMGASISGTASVASSWVLDVLDAL